VVNYLIFNPDEEWIEGKYMDSKVKNWIEELIFTDARIIKNDGTLPIEEKNITINYIIKGIKIDYKNVNSISKYLPLFSDIYDLTKVPKLPDEPIAIGNIKLVDAKNPKEKHEYIFVLEDFEVPLAPIYKKETEEPYLRVSLKDMENEDWKEEFHKD